MRSLSDQPSYNKQLGLSYVEVLVASSLIVLILLPALEALYPGIHGAELNKTQTIDHFYLQDKMEQSLGLPFSELEATAISIADATVATAYSDSITTSDGRQIDRQVFLATYDGDNADGDNDPFTGADPGLLWLKVSITQSLLALETVVRQ